MKDYLNEISAFLPQELCGYIARLDRYIVSHIEEITIRKTRPVSLRVDGKNLMIGQNGALGAAAVRPYAVCEADFEAVFMKLCRNSVYRYYQDILKGFITLDGGHRAGLCGTAVVDREGAVTGIGDISTINVRIAREVRGSADDLYRLAFCGGLKSLLLAAPPGFGKTTVLRDLARQLSERGNKVCVIDERSEIACARHGVPCLNVGALTDVFDGICKTEGIQRALRSLSPDVIICDEIGGEDEAKSVLGALNCGVPTIASVHASCADELLARPSIAALICAGAFEKIAFLGGDKKLKELTNADVVLKNSRFSSNILHRNLPVGADKKEDIPAEKTVVVGLSR